MENFTCHTCSDKNEILKKRGGRYHCNNQLISLKLTDNLGNKGITTMNNKETNKSKKHNREKTKDRETWTHKNPGVISGGP